MPKLLISKQKYLASGIHIGMKSKTKDMERFIYKVRIDGVATLNLKTIDERLRVASKFLARSKKILVAGRLLVTHGIIEKFAEIVDAYAVPGRFMPGSLTNPSYRKFFDVDIVLVTDPLIDKQAVDEAVKARVPVIAICNTFNHIKNIDFVIPANNKGKKSLATIFWILAREILKIRGEIKSDSQFKYKIEDFLV
ncbi:MAG: 30S ribosomal protein S2 [Candidatus Aenigmatarchaeota archaeon]